MEAVATKYESKLDDIELEYNKKLRHASLLNGTLIDIANDDLTYQEAKEYFFIENSDKIAYSYKKTDGTIHEVPIKEISNYTDYWSKMPDLYFYLYHSVQPDIEWHSKEAPTKTTILS